MAKVKRDEDREERISMEIVVDAYGAEEQAMGWCYYVEDRLEFPFTAECTQKRAIPPLRVGDEVDVIGMAPEDEREREMFVTIRSAKRLNILGKRLKTGITGSGWGMSLGDTNVKDVQKPLNAVICR